MIGLTMLFVVWVYIALCAVVVSLSYRFAFKVTASKKKSSAVRAVFCVIMFLGPFWDLIPTLVMHRYYCLTQAGFLVYKSPAEWVKENSAEAELLENYEEMKNVYSRKGYSKYFINDRFMEEINSSTNVFHAVNREDMIFSDRNKNKVLIKVTDFRFGSGMASIHSGGSLEAWRRFFVFGWFEHRACNIDETLSRKKYLKYRDDYMSIGGAK